MASRTVQVTRELSFAAARSLPHVLGARTGPHRYRVVLTVAGPLDERGLVVDFAELDLRAGPVLDRLDGADLVELLGHPSAEVIAVWLVERLAPLQPGLVSVQVWENDRSSAVAHAG
ncbi:6-pyruvoyl trahydropterin synthase family protein [Ornithinimicrobium pekingense]|nr:6-carboxytetrahydropterin synthase [Ornithinimicrobium pekingense]